MNNTTKTILNVGSALAGVPFAGEVAGFLASLGNLFSGAPYLSADQRNTIAWGVANKVTAKLKAAVPADSWAKFSGAFHAAAVENFNRYFTRSDAWIAQTRNRLTNPAVDFGPLTSTGKANMFAWTVWALLVDYLAGVKADGRAQSEAEYRVSIAINQVVGPAIRAAALVVEVPEGDVWPPEVDENNEPKTGGAVEAVGTKIAGAWSGLPQWVQVAIAVGLAAALFVALNRKGR